MVHRTPIAQLTTSSRLIRDSPLFRTRISLPAVWMRAGTSKGLFLHRNHLPARAEEWTPILLSAMGSRDADPLQLDGAGGGTPTTSKIAIVAPSRRPGIDVDYTFAQVAVGASKLDMSGNCGNIASGVGPFAIDEGLIELEPGQTRVNVRIFNTNTSRIIQEEMRVDERGYFVEDGDYYIPGVQSSGSRILMSFEKPAGAMTGNLLPSGKATNILRVPDPLSGAIHSVRISAIDAANPFIFVDESSMPPKVQACALSSAAYLEFIETIRTLGSVLMGLASGVEEAALTRGTPKIAVVSPPLWSCRDFSGQRPDVRVRSFTMGLPHSSLQLTGAVPLATAACIKGTVVHDIVANAVEPPHPHVSAAFTKKSMGAEREIVIQHPKGDMPVGVELDADMNVSRVTVSRTARRLFEGRGVCYV